VEAYQQKRGEMEAAEAGLSTKAERFFVLVQVRWPRGSELA
jgi:hypothetical protein